MAGGLAKTSEGRRAMIDSLLPTLSGPGQIYINSGQIDIAGTVTKRMNVTGKLVMNGTTFQPIVYSNAEITTDAGGFAASLLDFEDFNFIKSGKISAYGDIFAKPSGTIAILPDGQLHGDSNLIAQLDTEILIDGTVVISGDANILGKIAVGGFGLLEATNIVLNPTSGARFDGKVKAQHIYASGDVAVSHEVDFDVEMFELLAYSKLHGGGSLANTPMIASTLAILSPGNSPGQLTVKDLDMRAGAIYEFEVRDTTGAAGIDYDRINVVDILTLQNDPGNPVSINLLSLDVNNDPGEATHFDMSSNYAWTLISAGNIAGFDPAGFVVDATGFLNAVNGLFSVSKVGNELKLVYSPQAVALPGDFNGDGQVGAADYVHWRKFDGSPVTYETWRANFGRTMSNGGGTIVGVSNVPEPASIPILLLSSLILMSSRPSRYSR